MKGAGTFVWQEACLNEEFQDNILSLEVPLKLEEEGNQ